MLCCQQALVPCHSLPVATTGEGHTPVRMLRLRRRSISSSSESVSSSEEMPPIAPPFRTPRDAGAENAVSAYQTAHGTHCYIAFAPQQQQLRCTVCRNDTCGWLKAWQAAQKCSCRRFSFSNDQAYMMGYSEYTYCVYGKLSYQSYVLLRFKLRT